jgi:hypothetical protein
MRNFPTREALVAAYWRKLVRFNGAAYSGRGRVSVRRAARTSGTRQRASRRSSSGHSVARG